jgi:hypothetical protein
VVPGAWSFGCDAAKKSGAAGARGEAKSCKPAKVKEDTLVFGEYLKQDQKKK